MPAFNIVPVMIDNDTSRLLFELIIQHYLVVRGFSTTARWLEIYKIKQKKNIQKSKGLGKKNTVLTIQYNFNNSY